MSRLTVCAAAAAVLIPISSSAIAQAFDGSYVGATIAFGFNAPVVPDHEVAAFVGYNHVMASDFVAGGELDVALNPDSLWGGSALTGKLGARAGYLVTEDILVYGRAGGGYTTGATGSAVWDIGAGGEYAIGDTLSLRGEFDRVDPFVAGMTTQYNAKVGVAYNF